MKKIPRAKFFQKSENPKNNFWTFFEKISFPFSRKLFFEKFPGNILRKISGNIFSKNFEKFALEVAISDEFLDASFRESAHAPTPCLHREARRL